VDEDYPAGSEINEPLPEWSHRRRLESSTLEIDVYVWRYALVVVYVRNWWMNECMYEWMKAYLVLYILWQQRDQIIQESILIQSIVTIIFSLAFNLTTLHSHMQLLSIFTQNKQ